eukprot:COSAG06_NODE_1387_length_9616_cov_4.512136_6_plen_291_part_00
MRRLTKNKKTPEIIDLDADDSVRTGTPVYDDVEGLVNTLGIMAALICMTALSMVLGVSKDEWMNADIMFLAQNCPCFRSYFAPNNNLDVCTGTIPVGQVECALGERCSGCDMTPSAQCGLDCYREYWWGDCTPAHMKRSREIASSVNASEYAEWVELHYQDGIKSPSNKMTWKGFCETIHTTCMFRTGLSPFVFWGISDRSPRLSDVVLLLSLALMTSVALYVSLQFSQAREDPRTLARWWSGGKFVVLISYFFLLGSIWLFFEVLDSVTMVRLPFAEQGGFFGAQNYRR